MTIEAEHSGPEKGHRDLHVEFQDRRSVAAPLPVGRGSMARLLKSTLERAGIVGPARVEVTWVDPDEIAELNAEHLGGDGPTDVLSFPLDPFPDSALLGESGGREDPTGTMPLRMIGDVVIAPDVAKAQASGHAGSPADELALLLVHAGLHLAGHDHAEPEETAAMVALEQELLAAYWGPLAADPWAANPADDAANDNCGRR